MTTDALTGEAAGVPYVALAPPVAAADAPAVVVWHLLDPPRSETAMAAALPLAGLPAWRIYLGLPLLGSRLPEGGLDGFYQLALEDAVMKIVEPIVNGAVAELPGALDELRARLGLTTGRIALVGCSLGALVALTVLTETETPVSAVALVSPTTRLTAMIGANERRFGVAYPWSEQSRAVAARWDFVARAGEVAARGVPLLLVVGERDDEQGFRRPAAELQGAVGAGAELVEISGMEHALADEPGLEPAPRTAHAAQVDTTVADWLRRHLADESARGHRS
jgi:pimeloyl-ACP methyl ester carboxylesterase